MVRGGAHNGSRTPRHKGGARIGALVTTFLLLMAGIVVSAQGPGNVSASSGNGSNGSNGGGQGGHHDDGCNHEAETHDEGDHTTSTSIPVACATLTLNKIVVNDDTGTATIADFALVAQTESGVNVIDGVDPDISASVGISAVVPVDESIALGESGPPGYDASGWECSAGTLEGDLLTLQAGDVADCTITNDDQAESTIKLVKFPNNLHGGNLDASDFQLQIDGIDEEQGQAISVTPDVAHTIGEVHQDGYRLAGVGCQDADSNEVVEYDDGVTVASDQHLVCTVVNEDIAPTITVFNEVINNNDGTAEPQDFRLTVNGDQVGLGDPYEVMANEPSEVSEDPDTMDGYVATNVVCTSDNPDSPNNMTVVDSGTIEVTPALAEKIECTITNDDVSTGLTVVNNVVNNSGGDAVAADFPLQVDGETVVSGRANHLAPGFAREVTETQQPGYVAINITCVSDADPAVTDNNIDLDDPTGTLATVTLAPDEAVVCTITNDDEPIDLAITKSDDGMAHVAGGPAFDYTITVDNLGPRDAAHTRPVTVTDQLPAGLSFISFPTPECTAVGQTLTCNLDPADLHVADAPVVITVTVRAGADTASGTVTNMAFVDTTGDPACVGDNCVPKCDTSSNNVACATTEITRQAAVTIDNVDVEIHPGATVAADTIDAVPANNTDSASVTIPTAGSHALFAPVGTSATGSLGAGRAFLPRTGNSSLSGPLTLGGLLLLGGIMALSISRRRRRTTTA